MVKLENLPVKAEDIDRLDANTASLDIPNQLLMECAGLQATNSICSHYNMEKISQIFVFCGKGNNGGDGFVIARHLATRGYQINVVLLGRPENINSSESKLNWNILQNLLININTFTLKDSSQVAQFFKERILKTQSQEKIMIMDALLGTGIKGKIREPIASAINFINKSQAKIISVDVPSGMNPNTGKTPDISVTCEFRITFHRDKIGLASNRDESSVVVAPIGTPLESHVFVGDGDLRKTMKQRRRDVHKGLFGKVLIIGGSSEYSGAPALAAMICQKLGIDLVQCLVPQVVDDVIRSYSPNLIVKSGRNCDLGAKDVPYAKDLTEWADAVLIGPGIGISSETEIFFNRFFPWLIKQGVPFVVDADGIKLLAKCLKNKKIENLPSHCIITPHQGELATLTELGDIPSYVNIMERGNYFLEKTNHLIGTFLIKGVHDYIINKEQKVHKFRVNTTGCAEMSVGGTGDVLAGLNVAFLSLGYDPFSSACSSAYLNGLLGEYARAAFGPRIQATDLIELCREFLKKKGF